MAATTTPQLCGAPRVSCWPHIGRSTCSTSVMLIHFAAARDGSNVMPPCLKDIPGKMTFKESDALCPGTKFTTFTTPWCEVGLGICYDIRFAELAQVYSQAMNCRLLVYPGAFNMTTGELGQSPDSALHRHHGQDPPTGSCWPGPARWITRCTWPRRAPPATPRLRTWPGVTPPWSAPGARSWPPPSTRRTSSWPTST